MKFCLTMADPDSFQNIDLSSWITLLVQWWIDRVLDKYVTWNIADWVLVLAVCLKEQKITITFLGSIKIWQYW